ncbi:MAG: RNA polymerase sigma factor [Myxococcota bacterium]
MKRYVSDGDRTAFEEIFRRYAPRLLRFFRRSTLNDALAQDLTQVTFLHLHRARRDFRAGATLRPWLFAIAMNARREHFRKSRRRVPTTTDPAQEPSQPPDASTATERLVRRALAELPEAQREVVLLHYYEGLSMAEVAAAVGASRSAVKVRAHRAYQVLRHILDGTESVEEHRSGERP